MKTELLGSYHQHGNEEMITVTDQEKLQLINRIVDLQLDNANDDEGDRYLADPALAMEAIEIVLYDGPRSNGALRQYVEAAS